MTTFLAWLAVLPPAWQITIAAALLSVVSAASSAASKALAPKHPTLATGLANFAKILPGDFAGMRGTPGPSPVVPPALTPPPDLTPDVEPVTAKTPVAPPEPR